MTRTGRPRRIRRTIGCVSPASRLDSFAAIAADYRAEYRARARAELDCFQSQPSLARAVKLAGLAQGPDGHRLGHQRRIPPVALSRAAAALRARTAGLERCADFEALIRLVENTIGPVRHVGELMIYDTALRIGAKLKLEPAEVYLHRGTREGAIALGLDGGRRSVRPEELPPAFRSLEPHEIEDCLCIYKAELARIAGRLRRGDGREPSGG